MTPEGSDALLGGVGPAFRNGRHPESSTSIRPATRTGRATGGPCETRRRVRSADRGARRTRRSATTRAARSASPVVADRGGGGDCAGGRVGVRNGVGRHLGVEPGVPDHAVAGAGRRHRARDLGTPRRSAAAAVDVEGLVGACGAAGRRRGAGRPARLPPTTVGRPDRPRRARGRQRGDHRRLEIVDPAHPDQRSAHHRARLLSRSEGRPAGLRPRAAPDRRSGLPGRHLQAALQPRDPRLERRRRGDRRPRRRHRQVGGGRPLARRCDRLELRRDRP